MRGARGKAVIGALIVAVVLAAGVWAWRWLGPGVTDRPPALAFELLNEPHAQLDAERWNALSGEAIALVRRTNSTRRIVVGPVGWNSIDELPKLRLPAADRREPPRRRALSTGSPDVSRSGETVPSRCCPVVSDRQ